MDEDCDGLVDEDFIAAGDILVTEVMNNSVAVSDLSGEWFEVYNTTSYDIDMVNWSVIGDDGDVMSIDNSLVVAADDFAVLASNGSKATNSGVVVNYDYDRSTFELADYTTRLYFDGFRCHLRDVLRFDILEVVAGATLSLDPNLRRHQCSVCVQLVRG